MEIVCDTNVWYKIGQNAIEESTYKEHRLIGTYVSIDELSRSEQLITNPELVRNALRVLMTVASMRFYEPPLIYVKKLNNPSYAYNVVNELRSILSFTKEIANEGEILAGKMEEYLDYCYKQKDRLKDFVDLLNNQAALIKPNIKNKEKHREASTIEANRGLISLMVASQTNSAGLDENFDWKQIEFFENVLAVLLKEMEVGAVILKQNDVFDLFNMMYVTPGRLYWTDEKNKWKKIIEKAGMEKYLFNPNEKTDNVEG